MKYVKLLGLAAVAAAALMAFVGAGTASATVLCKTNTIPCGATGWTYGAGTEIHATQEETGILEDTNNNELVTCTESTLLATTLNHGSASETVRAAVTKLTFGGCTATVKVVTLGELEIHHIEGSGTDGTLTAKNSKVTVSIFGVSCTYGAGNGIDLGTLTHSTSDTSKATVDINAVVAKVEGGFLCPATARWTAHYIITEPVPLYIKDS